MRRLRTRRTLHRKMRGSSVEVLLVVSGVSLVSVLLSYQWVATPWAAPAALPAPSAVFIGPHLHRILRSLESQQLGAEANRRVAKIQGAQRDAATLYASLADVNYQVNTTSQDWSLLVCSPHSACPVGRLADGQMVSQVPGLSTLLASPGAVCRLQRRLAEAALGGPRCFVLPQHLDEMLNEADGAANSTEWLLGPRDEADGRPEAALTTFQLLHNARNKKFPETGVIKTWSRPLLLIGGQYSFRAHFTILITSMAPVRAYLDERRGRVRLKNKFNSSEHELVWSLKKLWTTLKDDGTARIRVRRALLFLLLTAENSLAKYLPATNRQNFFQLITAEVTLDEDLWPVVLGLDPDPLVDRTVLSSALRLVTATDWVHDELTQALMQSGAGCDARKCPPSRDDFLFLMSARREAMYASSFFRLYPQSTPLPHKWIAHLTNETVKHVTAEGDTLYSSLEKFFASNKSNLPDSNDQTLQFNTNLESLHVIPGKYLEPDDNSAALNAQDECSEYEESASFLRFLTTDQGEVSPPFDPELKTYNLQVPYNRTLVQVKAAPANCRTQIFFDDQPKSSLSYKSSVGLGENKVSIRLQALNKTLSTYWLTLTRHPERPEAPFDSSEPHQVCSFKQDCKFKFSPSESCGMQLEATFRDWPSAARYFSRMAACTNGDAPGRWILPCIECDAADSCWWDEARWQPFECRHARVAQPLKCLADKQVLFVGDSTVRGMMHSVLERLNGTLGVRDKSHALSHFRVGRRTLLAFAYYPQFWLAPPRRPVFAKTLYQLLLSAQPLKNSSDTIVVVGGVHWLATSHLHTLMNILKREGLEGAKIVIKTLGSGFHIPADGVHLLSTRQQEKLVLHSQGLAAFGKHFHMEVVDTFNMTAARFRDFLPGKCACHFHTVSEGSAAGEFHVEGGVNAIYSEILLARMCS